MIHLQGKRVEKMITLEDIREARRTITGLVHRDAVDACDRHWRACGR